MVISFSHLINFCHVAASPHNPFPTWFPVLLTILLHSLPLIDASLTGLFWSTTPGSSSPWAPSSHVLFPGWFAWCHWCGAQSWPVHFPAWTFPVRNRIGWRTETDASNLTFSSLHKKLNYSSYSFKKKMTGWQPQCLYLGVGPTRSSPMRTPGTINLTIFGETAPSSSSCCLTRNSYIAWGCKLNHSLIIWGKVKLDCNCLGFLCLGSQWSSLVIFSCIASNTHDLGLKPWCPKAAFLTKHRVSLTPKGRLVPTNHHTWRLRARWRVLVCSKSLWEYFRRICKPCAWDWTWRSSASFRLAFICSCRQERGRHQK